MSDNADLIALMHAEVDALRHVLDLREARLRRLEERVAGRTDEVTYWVASDEEEEEDQTLRAYERFAPVAWWDWTPEQWEAHDQPPDAL